MSRRMDKDYTRRVSANQRRTKQSFSEMLSTANRRAHEQANRRSDRRGMKSVRAAIAASDEIEDAFSVEWWRRLGRWMMALCLLPFCWVTTWTFLSRFSRATLERGFWHSTEFWYFAIGALLMVGWFWSGLIRSFFLYLYVLGHELTHVLFVLCCRGKVTDFHVSTEGGYITTNKTNMLIALSPYFVPFWSVVCAVVYMALRFFVELSSWWDLVMYALMGLTWTFHMVWTLWMIPRDQPDLKENGTFLSLVVIYLANLMVLAGLLCVAGDSPLRDTRDFAYEWMRHAATWGQLFWRLGVETAVEMRAHWGL